MHIIKDKTTITYETQELLKTGWFTVAYGDDLTEERARFLRFKNQDKDTFFRFIKVITHVKDELLFGPE